MARRRPRAESVSRKKKQRRARRVVDTLALAFSLLSPPLRVQRIVRPFSLPATRLIQARHTLISKLAAAESIPGVQSGGGGGDAWPADSAVAAARRRRWPPAQRNPESRLASTPTTPVNSWLKFVTVRFFSAAACLLHRRRRRHHQFHSFKRATCCIALRHTRFAARNFEDPHTAQRRRSERGAAIAIAIAPDNYKQDKKRQRPVVGAADDTAAQSRTSQLDRLSSVISLVNNSVREIRSQSIS